MAKKNEFKLVIFDLDGTISDSFDLCLGSINKILKDRGCEGITEREKQEAKNLPAREVFKYFKIPSYQLPFVVRTILKTMERNYDKVKIFKGIKRVLRVLNKRGYCVVMLTSNIKDNTEEFNKREGISEFFEGVYHKSGIFSKHVVIDKLAKKYQVKKREVVMIGDEVRDVDAAKKSKINMIAVGWGFNSEEALRKADPDYFVHKPADILEIINTKNKY